MLGKTVLYKLLDNRRLEILRVGIVTRVYETGEVDLAVFAQWDDYAHPLDQPVKKLRKVALGDGVGECVLIEEPKAVAVPKSWFQMNAEERKAYQEAKKENGGVHAE
jgi:hypothetical protein